MTRPGRERGIAVLMVVLMINGLIVAVALSVDIGRLRVAEREAQRVADVAALDAARFLAIPAPTPEALVTLVEDAAVRSAGRNHLVLDADDVDLGHLRGSTWEEAMPGTASWPPTSVQVTGRIATSWLFQPGGRQVQRSAVAEAQSSAAFWLGSGLASLATQDSPILHPVMTALTGDADGTIDLVSWRSLADVSVRLGDLIARATASGVDDYLDVELGIDQHLLLMAEALAQDGFLEAAASLETLALVLQSSPLPPVALGDLIAVDSPSSPNALAARLGVLDVVHGLLLLGHAGGPAIQLDLDVDLGPIARTSIEARVTEPPQYAVGGVGTSASTAQIDLRLVVEVPLIQEVRNALNQLLVPPLGGLLAAVLNPIVNLVGTLRIELVLEGAASQATITDLACAADGGGQVTFVVESRLLDGGLGVLGGNVPVTLAGASSATVTMVSPFGPDRTVVVPGPLPDIGALAAAALPGAVAALTGPLLGGLLSGLLQPVTAAVTAVLSPVTISIHEQVIVPTLSALGITTANAHLTVDSVACQSVRLTR